MAATAVTSSSTPVTSVAVAVAASSGAGEVGISPVLLQAITHTLSSSSSTKTTEPIIIRRKAPITQHIKIEQTSPAKPSSHILSGLHEPIGTTPGNTVLYVNSEQPEEQVETVETTGEVDWSQVEEEASVTDESSSQDTSNHVVAQSTIHMGNVVSQSNDINMGSVLSAIATHFKSRGGVIKQENVKVEAAEKLTIVEPMSPMPQSSTSRPVIVTESVEEIAQTLVVQSASPPIKKPRIELADHTNTEPTNTTFVIHKIGENNYVDANTGEPIEVQNVDGQLMLNPDSSFLLQNQNNLVINNQEDYKPCPICGDKISGM